MQRPPASRHSSLFSVTVRGAKNTLVLSLCGLLTVPLRAADVRNLADLTIEQLLNEPVTSVAKKETPLHESPAAISVITPNDIRRHGLRSLPEALRLLPGLDVARVGASETAVSVRGFNNVFANKLLVLIDGRAVYSPASGGVFWNVQDVAFEDLSRIEVIRGPGATLWGANAVNGVINILSKSARETQGTLVATTVGTEDEPTVTVRHGGQLAPHLFYRAYAKYFDRSALTALNGSDARDGWDSFRTGFRTDYEPSVENTVTVQGDYYRTDARKNLNVSSLTPPYAQTVNRLVHNRGLNVLGRWTHRHSETSLLTMQAYLDNLTQDTASSVNRVDTFDFDLHHQVTLGERHELTWGAGYRGTKTRDTSTFGTSWTHDRHRLRLFNLFAQDEIVLLPERLHFILGSKLEHNNLTGFESEPSARLRWTLGSGQTLWAAVSRAIRTPSFFERDGRLNVAAGPGFLVSILANPNLAEEKLTAYEVGYRVAPTKQLSFDFAGYYNVYEGLIVFQENPPTFESNPLPPHALLSQGWRNAGHGQTYGAELSVQWQVTESWRLTGSHTWLRTNLVSAPESNAISPRQQFQLRSDLDLSRRLELNAAAYYVGPIVATTGQRPTAIPSYVRMDLGLVFRLRDSLELGVWGTNLLDRRHLEFASPETSVIADVPRGVTGKITWRF